MIYVRVRSWHVVKHTRLDSYGTLCGRYVGWPATVTDDLPLDEKSCETCLRLSVSLSQVERAIAAERDPEP